MRLSGLTPPLPLAVVDEPTEDPKARIHFGEMHYWQDFAIYRAYGSRPGEMDRLQRIRAMQPKIGFGLGKLEVGSAFADSASPVWPHLMA